MIYGRTHNIREFMLSIKIYKWKIIVSLDVMELAHWLLRNSLLISIIISSLSQKEDIEIEALPLSFKNLNNASFPLCLYARLSQDERFHDRFKSTHYAFIILQFKLFYSNKKNYLSPLRLAPSDASGEGWCRGCSQTAVVLLLQASNFSAAAPKETTDAGDTDKELVGLFKILAVGAAWCNTEGGGTSFLNLSTSFFKASFSLIKRSFSFKDVVSTSWRRCWICKLKKDY